MTMAELYSAPEKLDGGAAMVETIKAEVGKLNVESKEQREAKEKAEALVKTLTEAKDTLANQIAELQKPGAGEQTAEYKTLLKKFDDLSKSFETEKAARQEAEQKRIQTDIMAQTVDALTKHNAMDPKEFAKLIVGGIEVGDDGKYGFKKEDGTVGTIEDAATTWLKGKPWAVKDNQNGGSGQGSSGQNAGNDVKAQFEAALGISQATKGD